MVFVYNVDFVNDNVNFVRVEVNFLNAEVDFLDCRFWDNTIIINYKLLIFNFLLEQKHKIQD